MKNLSMMHYFLGQEEGQMTYKIFPSQGKYTLKILKKLSMTDCKIHRVGFKEKIDDDSDETDPQLTRSLMYLVNTRLDSYHAVNVPSHFMNQPRQTH
jgi:hypothetical protein